MPALPDPLKHRKADHAVESIFLRRWSPRSLSGEPIGDDELKRLLEAARWAPSAFNEQPWRFLYAKRGTPHFDVFFDCLVEGNQAWCKTAAVLLCVVTHKTFARNGKPNPVAVFDAGAAWENLALQAASMGLIAHGMAGFNASKARASLAIPDDYETCAMIAVGKPGDTDNLAENLRGGETPNGRKPVAEIAFEGKFPA